MAGHTIHLFQMPSLHVRIKPAVSVNSFLYLRIFMHFRKIYFYISAFLFSASSSASAENRVFYFESAKGSIFYYDSDTIRRNGNIVLVWVYEDASRDKSVKWRSASMRFRFDCFEETYDLVAISQYGSDGVTIYSNQRSGYPDMTPVRPGTNTRLLFDAVCSN